MLEPIEEELLERLLADSNGRVRPDRGNAALGRHRQTRVRICDNDVGEPRALRVESGKLSCSFVDINSEHGRLWRRRGESESNRTPATADIDEQPLLGRFGHMLEKDLCSLIDPIVGEYTTRSDNREAGASDQEAVLTALLWLRGLWGKIVV